MADFISKITSLKPEKQIDNSKAPAANKCEVEKVNVPAYSDLGKKVKKLFTKGFGYGFVGIKGKTTPACSDIEVGGKMKYCHDTSEVLGLLSVKKIWPERDLMIYAKTYSNQKVSLEMSRDKLFGGVKLGADLDIMPMLSKSELGVKAILKNNRVTSRIGFEFSGTYFSENSVKWSTVLGHKNYFAGASMGYDISNHKMTNFDVTMARAWKDLDMLLSLKSFMTELHGMMRVDYNDNVEVGAEVVAKRGGRTNTIGIVAAYHYPLHSNISKDITLKGKINTDHDIGLSVCNRINENVSVTVSALINGRHMTDYNQYKWGIGLRF